MRTAKGNPLAEAYYARFGLSTREIPIPRAVHGSFSFDYTPRVPVV